MEFTGVAAMARAAGFPGPSSSLPGCFPSGCLGQGACYHLHFRDVNQWRRKEHLSLDSQDDKLGYDTVKVPKFTYESIPGLRHQSSRAFKVCHPNSLCCLYSLLGGLVAARHGGTHLPYQQCGGRPAWTSLCQNAQCSVIQYNDKMSLF